ncbi:MAG: carbohydrate ABC transporter permease [Spirochaetes bacterium]|nr:MAG: carbohydrate ABC transporter permease [Spirochaetota bacterium]
MKRYMHFDKALIYSFLIILSLIWIFPLVSMIIVIFKSPDEFNSLHYWVLPPIKNILKNIGSNIAYAWVKAKIGMNFINSLIFAFSAGVGSAFIASMGGYALVHLKIKRPQSWFFGIFIGNLFPFQMFLIPLYLFLNKLGLYDTRTGLIIVYVGICVPFALFVYRNYAYTLPGEIFDAAKVDGAGKWKSFLKIFLPMSKPAFAVVFIFQFIWTWNDLLFGLILTERYRPIMTALSKLQGARGGVPVTILIAGALIASIPTIIVLLSLQKFFVRGFTLTAGK